MQNIVKPIFVFLLPIFRMPKNTSFSALAMVKMKVTVIVVIMVMVMVMVMMMVTNVFLRNQHQSRESPVHPVS